LCGGLHTAVAVAYVLTVHLHLLASTAFVVLAQFRPLLAHVLATPSHNNPPRRFSSRHHCRRLRLHISTTSVECSPFLLCHNLLAELETRDAGHGIDDERCMEASPFQGAMIAHLYQVKGHTTSIGSSSCLEEMWRIRPKSMVLSIIYLFCFYILLVFIISSPHLQKRYETGRRLLA
jgi:hypothetical protein